MINVSAYNYSALRNGTNRSNLIYVFTPARFTTKLTLCLLLVTIGVVGFVGNSFIFYFLTKNKPITPLRSSRFVKNLNFYVRSLALSDVLCNAVSIPLTCIQIYVDVFQKGWGCKVVRYLNSVFPTITINNLMVISVEKYFSTRKIPRTFRFSTVRKLVYIAWLLGCVVMLIPAATCYGKLFHLNDTHFTVICKYNNHFYPFRFLWILLPVQYVIPAIILVYINICLIKTVWARGRVSGLSQANSPFKAKLRAIKVRGTTLLISIAFAFIIPYSCYMAYVVRNQVTKPNLDFETDYIIRCVSAGLIYCNSATNFIIYLVQMKDFRAFLKRTICKEAISEPQKVDKKWHINGDQYIARDIIELKEVKMAIADPQSLANLGPTNHGLNNGCAGEENGEA